MPVIRTVERRELPSTKQATTLTCSSFVNLFMCIIYSFMLERSSIKINNCLEGRAGGYPARLELLRESVRTETTADCIGGQDELARLYSPPAVATCVSLHDL